MLRPAIASGGFGWPWNTTMRDLLVSTQAKKGHEAGSWYEGVEGGHGAEARGVQGEGCLHPLQGVDDEGAGEVEQQHRRRVPGPGHVLLGVDPREAVEGSFEWPECALRESSLPRVDAAHVGAERRGEPEEQREVDDELERAVGGHERRSGNRRAKPR